MDLNWQQCTRILNGMMKFLSNVISVNKSAPLTVPELYRLLTPPIERGTVGIHLTSSCFLSALPARWYGLFLLFSCCGQSW